MGGWGGRCSVAGVVRVRGGVGVSSHTSMHHVQKLDDRPCWACEPRKNNVLSHKHR